MGVLSGFPARAPGVPSRSLCAAPFLLCVAALLLSGCPSPRGPEALVDHALWELADPGDDPFGRSWPADPDAACLSSSWFAEALGAEPSLTIDLAECSFVVLRQSALVEVRRDDLLALRLWHDALFFDAAPGVELGLALDGAVVWTATLPAPGDSGLESAELEAIVATDAGAPVHFFVDAHQEVGARHGGDSLNLIEWSRRDSRWEPEG